MNTSKRERIIKNLYDLQCLDSWEDGSDFVAAVCAVLENNGCRMMPIDVVMENRGEVVCSHAREEGFNATIEYVEEDEKMSYYRQFSDSEEAFSDSTNYNMSFDKFRNICYEFIDF